MGYRHRKAPIRKKRKTRKTKNTPRKRLTKRTRSRSGSQKAPLPRNWSMGNRNRRVTLSWGIKRYLSKLKKAGL